MIKALVDALHKLSELKIQPDDVAKLGIVEGRMKEDANVERMIDEEKTETPKEE